MSKKVIISGANGNLGKSVVSKFLAENWLVIALLQPNDQSVLKSHPNLELVFADLSLEEDAQKAVDEIFKKHNSIDALIMLAGGFAMGDIYATDYELLQRMIHLNFFTAYNIARPVFGQMKNQPSGGKMIFMGAKPALESSAGKEAIAYSLSKSMLFKFSELINEDGKNKNIHSAIITPGIIDTPANRHAMPDAHFNDWVSPENLSDLIYLCCSETGKNLRETVLKVYGNV